MYTKNGKLEDILRAALTKAGLPRIRIHDCRHVYAAHFIMAGGSIFDLQKNLGHHSVAFTEKVYGHLSPDHRAREAERMAGLFAAPPAPPAAATDNVIPFPAAASTKCPDSAQAGGRYEEATEGAAEIVRHSR